jgi:hypothetical protein
MRSLNAPLTNWVVFAVLALLSAAFAGCGRASSTDPASVTLPPPEPPADQGEPLEKGALPGSLHLRFIFGVVSGDTGVMAQALARFTQSERLVGARTVLVEAAAFLGSKHIVNAEVAPEGRPNSAAVALFFDPSGAEIFRKTTAKLVNRRIAVALNGRVSMLPVVMSEIPGGKTWIQVPAGRDALEKARELAEKIKRGPLPGKLDFQVEELI